MSDLAATLDGLAVFVRRFVVLSGAQADAVALWIAHTHAFDASEVTPYLAVTSAEKRSGKSRLLEVLALLVSTPLPAAGVTEAALFRSIGERCPTLLMDEVDAVFGPKTAAHHEDLRALFNAGYRKGTPVLRCVGDGSRQRVVEFPVFCPKALAGIGRLPDTVADRSVPLRLKRRAPGETVERFRRRDAEAEAEPLRLSIQSIAGHHVERLADARPELPVELDDRAADGWEPLLAIADLAGSGWPERARRAALTLSGEQAVEDDSAGVRLLADVRTVFDRESVDRLSSETLVSALSEDQEAPWADWGGKGISQRSLAALLRRYGIRSATVRLADGTTAKGYKREDFEDAWKRYLPESDSPSVTSVTTAQPSGLPAFSDPSHEADVTDRRNGANPHEQGDVSDVTDQTAISGWDG